MSDFHLFKMKIETQISENMKNIFWFKGWGEDRTITSKHHKAYKVSEKQLCSLTAHLEKNRKKSSIQEHLINNLYLSDQAWNYADNIRFALEE